MSAPPRGMSLGAPRNDAERLGAQKWGSYDNRSEVPVFPPGPFVLLSFSRPPTAVSHISRRRVGCWGVMFAPSGIPPGAQGAPRNASGRKNKGTTSRIRKFRPRARDLLFGMSRRRPHLRWFRVFSVSALGWVLGVMCAPRGMSP